MSKIIPPEILLEAYSQGVFPMAEDGEILLSPRAFTAVEDEMSAESSGEVSLKGIREPVEVFRLNNG